MRFHITVVFTDGTTEDVDGESKSLSHALLLWAKSVRDIQNISVFYITSED